MSNQSVEWSREDQKKQLLRSLSFGARIAEQEVKSLSGYFVETEQWRQLLSGAVDIVYGPKGAGKSALYSLLTTKESELFDAGIVIIPAENPDGATAFAEIKAEPPTSEHEFTGLWKLYFLCLIAQELRGYDVESKAANELYSYLEEARLLPSKRTLRTTLLGVRDYVKRLAQIESLEGGIGIDPATGMLSGVKGKITLREPDHEQREGGFVSVDTLLETADTALAEANLTGWLLLDRLDVAFAQSEDLEHNALRALFKAYLDMVPLQNIKIKVFLRTDIWHRITEGGFREASHITRHLTITWQRQSLLNLVMKRMLANRPLCEYYGVNREAVLASTKEQESLVKRMFPDQVDTGRNPASFDWMLGRTQDGTKSTAPRELIHLLSSMQEAQVARIEVGHALPPGELLFDRPVFKEALRPVSEERLTKTLFAENPDLKSYIEKLREEKTQQNTDTLARIWEVDATKARTIADKLVKVGFFESRGAKQAPIYWVPFLYRDALEMIQGEAR